jgi:allantoinase
MAPPDRVVRSERVLIDGQLRPASIQIERGRIAAVAGHDEIPDGAPLVDGGRQVVMAGLVDTHVHVNEPGRTEWEGFDTATAAAAAGGVTTLVDMPLNSVPPTTSRAALERKRDTAAGRVWIDVGFWGGVVPGNAGELEGLLDGGVLGCKCFLIDSGVAEFGHVGAAEMRPAMEILGAAGAPLLVHAELPGPVDAAAGAVATLDPTRYETFLRSRPPAAEDQAIALALEVCRNTRAPLHIVHHSSASAIEMLRRARDEGLPLTVETCPHYLHFAAEEIADGATEHKCCPPIRERDNRDRLWRALDDQVIDMVVSDHSPCTPELKQRERGDFMAAWGGIASLELGLAVTWTDARRRGYGVADVARWMCETPARMAGLTDKGRIAVGAAADLVIWDPDRSRAIDAAALHHKNPVTPYHGATLDGVVALTLLAGETIYERGQLVGRPRGQLVTRR